MVAAAAAQLPVVRDVKQEQQWDQWISGRLLRAFFFFQQGSVDRPAVSPPRNHLQSCKATMPLTCAVHVQYSTMRLANIVAARIQKHAYCQTAPQGLAPLVVTTVLVRKSLGRTVLGRLVDGHDAGDKRLGTYFNSSDTGTEVNFRLH